MTDRDVAPKPWSGRLKFLLVLALFVTPPLLAWLVVTQGWRPGGMANHGVLVEPPAPIAESALRGPLNFAGRWTLLVVAPGACEQVCLRTLDLARRAQIALNEHAERAQIAVVLPEGEQAPALGEQAPPVLFTTAAQARAWTTAARELGAPAVAVHLVDPRGFRMMAYPAPLDGRGLLKDLKRLMRASNPDLERMLRTGEAQ